MPARQITERTIRTVLIAGFALVILLLVAAGFVGVVNVRSIRRSASSLMAEQFINTRLIDEIQREQAAISAIFHRLARDPDTVDRARVLRQLEQARTAIRHTVAAAAATSEEPLWRDLEGAVAAFSDQATRFIDQQNEPSGATRTLVREHDRVISIVSRLIAASYRRANAAQQRIEAHSRDLVRQSSALLGGCLLLALLFTAMTVRVISGLFRRVEWQASELSRVSWHMLDQQETVARRFSHELHDELGQAMTALKANLVVLEPATASARGRKEDCVRLVDEAIGNIRELSQLLRPTILDDFGLEAGLKWLAEGFTVRTAIQVDYRADRLERLPEETETHLFRIAQEALTNVARHSGARRVAISLAQSAGAISLRIADDGRGLQDNGSGGMGMIGMRARARSLGGELSIGAAPEGGVEIRVSVPPRSMEHVPQSPSSAG